MMSLTADKPTPPLAGPINNKADPGNTADTQGLIDPDTLVHQLTSEEKIQLLSGDDMWHTVPIPRLGVPRVRVSTATSLLVEHRPRLT